MSQIATTATQPRRLTASRIGQCLAAFTLVLLTAISLRAATAPTGHSHAVLPRPVVSTPLPCWRRLALRVHHQRQPCLRAGGHVQRKRADREHLMSRLPAYQSSADCSIFPAACRRQPRASRLSKPQNGPSADDLGCGHAPRRR